MDEPLRMNFGQVGQLVLGYGAHVDGFEGCYGQREAFALVVEHHGEVVYMGNEDDGIFC